MKLITVIIRPAVRAGLSGGQLFKCLTTVVSVLCVMSNNYVPLESGE